MVMAGMSVLRQFCRNRNITRMTRTMASTRVTSTSLIDSRTTPTLSKASRHSSPGGNALLQPRHLRHDALVDLERVGGGQELDAHARGLEPDEAQVGGVGLGAQLHAADVADAHQGGRPSPALTTTFSNWRGSVRRPRARTLRV